jgi:glycosyltransferase involved in cell wall biosynthesis
VARALVEAALDGQVTLSKRHRQGQGDPRVSVAIPAYNPGYFATSLDSAIAQTYENLEICVCDDSPGDAIEAIVRDRQRRRAIRYERNERRLGTRANFIRCFERASGEFVKFLCDDDRLAPECVARLVEAFRAAPDVVLATSWRRRIDASGAELPPLPATQPIAPRSSVIAGYTLANAMLMSGLNTVGEPSTALFRKADFAGDGPEYFHFRGRPGHGVIDMVMWSSLLLRGDAVYLREGLSSFRTHAGQRQNDPQTRRRSIDSIRELQAAWLELGVHERQPPHLFLARPYPPDDADWQPQPVLGLAVRRVEMAGPAGGEALR